MKNKLLPCPKCGHVPDINDPDFLYPVDRSRTHDYINCYDGGNDSCDFQIITPACTIDEAVIIWNSYPR